MKNLNTFSDDIAIHLNLTVILYTLSPYGYSIAVLSLVFVFFAIINKLLGDWYDYNIYI